MSEKLQSYYNEHKVEAGVDEVGRGFKDIFSLINLAASGFERKKRLILSKIS